ncbi:MAG TPA: hypothetical protein VFA43_11255 [Gemmatimonadaceae bacterium]|nr:hypothetical protein [Gemmatimonadaceae bacterium]
MSPRPCETGPAPRAPYQPPVIEMLGAWGALTLQQSIPIGPSHVTRHPSVQPYVAPPPNH